MAHDLIADPGSILPRSGAIGNYNVTAAPAAEVISANGAESLELVIVVTNLGAAQTVTVTINGLDAFGNTYLLLASAAINANGTTRLKVGPRIASAANTVAQDLLPERVQISYALANGLNATFTVSATLFP